jgi:hypothetical protein
LRLRLIAWVLGAGAAFPVAACGGDDASDELVRVRIQDTLDFRMDKSDGPEHVIPIDATIVVDRDREGTTVDPEGTHSLKVSKDELERLKKDLARLDLPALERRFAAQDEDDSTITITYDGRTVVLDNLVAGISPGERDDLPRPSPAVDRLLQDLSRLPLDDIRRQTQAAPGPSCEAAKRVVDNNARKLDPDEKRQIYERVRQSDQPCP